MRTPSRPKGSPKTPGSGRQKGTPNKRTLAARACEAAGIDPFAFQAEVVAGKRKATMGQRLQAAAELCEYLQPKLSRTELTGEDGAPLQLGIVVLPAEVEP